MRVMISLASGFNRWVMPSDAKLALEYKVEYQLKNLGSMYENPFPKLSDFLNAVRTAKIEVISKVEDRRIENRSRCKTMEDLRSLVSRYRSWPEFRNDGTLRAIEAGFLQNRPMEMPIVFKYGAVKRIFSGNTRMDIAFMNNIDPHVICIRI